MSVLKWLTVNNWNSESIHGISSTASNVRLWKGNWNFLSLQVILHAWFSFSALFCSNIIPLTCSGIVPEHDLVRCSASSTLTERLHKKINSSLYWRWGGNKNKYKTNNKKLHTNQQTKTKENPTSKQKPTNKSQNNKQTNTQRKGKKKKKGVLEHLGAKSGEILKLPFDIWGGFF